VAFYEVLPLIEFPKTKTGKNSKILFIYIKKIGYNDTEHFPKRK